MPDGFQCAAPPMKSLIAMVDGDFQQHVFASLGCVIDERADRMAAYSAT